MGVQPAESILRNLSEHQYLHPVMPLDDVLADVVESTGACPQAAQQAKQWLRLDGERSIGRLRRSELMQLARSIHRFWVQSVEQMQGQPHTS